MTTHNVLMKRRNAANDGYDNILPITTAENVLIGADSDLRGHLDRSSYMAFCANVNTDSLDAAFGKNNEDRVKGLGLQLAMYAWFKGVNKVEFPFAELIKVPNLSGLNTEAMLEILSDSSLVSLINLSPYAKSVYNAFFNSHILELICIPASLNPIDYATTGDVLNNQMAATAVAQSSLSLKVMLEHSSTVNAMATSPTAMLALYNNATDEMEEIFRNSTVARTVLTNLSLSQSGGTLNKKALVVSMGSQTSYTGKSYSASTFITGSPTRNGSSPNILTPFAFVSTLIVDGNTTNASPYARYITWE